MLKMRVEYTNLLLFCESIFLKAGFSTEHAHEASKVLLSADMRGVDSHGIARLAGYLRLLKVNRINPRPNINCIHETFTTATLDADQAIGLISAPFAMKIAIEKANVYGTGWVAVQNSNHFGIAGYHAMLAAEKNMIGIALTNASPLVAPTFSLQRMLGTNPISIAIPAGKEAPFVLDMATTTAANGKLENLQRLNKESPQGWIQDAQGLESTDPNAVSKGGALLPLGGKREQGSHKGYGLGAMVDILSGVLSGANFGPWVPPFVAFLNPSDNPVGKGIGHFFGAMRVDAFQPLEEFQQRMDLWIQTFRNAKRVSEQQSVIVPGDPEREFEKMYAIEGIPINEVIWENLKEISQEWDETLPELL